jgi:hypothetical protein
MIRLDTQTNQKEKILEIISNAIDNDELELECLFNNSANKTNYSVSHDNFMAVLKRFKNNPEYDTKTNTRLAITFPRSSKFNDTRILIKGIGAINSFCNNEGLSTILNSVDFETKKRASTRINNLTLPNYNIKFNIKEEQNFNNDDARIKDIIREWGNEVKNYRYKKTFSFIKKTNDFQIDISIVKSSTNIDRFITVDEVIKHNLLRAVAMPSDVRMPFSVWWKSIENNPNEKVMVRNGDNYYKTIKESKVFTNAPTYEIEVEYIHNKTTVKPKFKNLDAKKEYITKEFMGFFRIIGSVLQCIQGSSFIISNQEKNNVVKQFTKVVVSSVNESMINLASTENKSKGHNNPTPLQKQQIQKQHQRGGYALTADGDINFEEQSSDNTETDNTKTDNKIVIDDETTDETTDGTTDETTDDNAGENSSVRNIYDVSGEDDTIGTEPEDDLEDNQKGGARKIAELRNRITEYFRKNGIFFGPLIIDLSHNNSLPLDPNALPDIATNTNIHINYLVTDKTDGERYLLFVDETGNTYGIDRESNIKAFGIVMPTLANTILDGEFVSRTEDNKVLNNFYIFDAYIYKGESVIHKGFLLAKPNGRHSVILEVIKYFTNGTNIIQSNSKMPFMLYKKDYLRGDSPKSYQNLYSDEKPLISQNCERLLNKMNIKYGGFLDVGHLYTYKTDGLVFLPNNLGVFQQFEDDELKATGGNPFVSGRWNNNYKWKPADHLTIDFRVEFIREFSDGIGKVDNDSKLAYRYLGDKKYLLVKLKSAVYQSKRGDNNALNFYLLNSGIKIQNIPTSFDFFAVDPFVGHFDNEGNLQNNMSEAYFEVDNNDNIICTNGDIINDGQIVECSYDIHIKDEQKRWNPHRVRADKPSPNNYLTAITTWGLINNPITKEHLSAIKHKPTNEQLVNDMETGKDKEDILENATYYSDNKNTIFLTDPLNYFNGFVKRYLINRALTGYVKPRVMDLATGKGGDMAKYATAGVHTLLGIEIGYDGLNNSFDGAATRMINLSQFNPAIAKLADRTMFIVGNTTKNIANGDCVRDNINKYYIDVLYGRAKGNTPKLKKLEGTALDQFDCISCMYAIHYMMNNENDLDNFLRNVSENLLDQGYFIGTCLDGMSILKAMGRSKELNGIIDGKTVFLIKKISDDPNEYKDITVGNKIMVHYEKFAGHFPENLVNMSYLRERAREHNLKLIEYKTFFEEPGNMLSQYESVDGKNAKKIKESEAMMTWGRFNAYFIFQKVRDSD